jgi:hypothetical protein
METFPYYLAPLSGAPFDGVLVWPGALAVAICFLLAVLVGLAIELGRHWVAVRAPQKKPVPRLVSRGHPQRHAA